MFYCGVFNLCAYLKRQSWVPRNEDKRSQKKEIEGKRRQEAYFFHYMRLNA
jgi:hypothetical protein